MTVRFLYIGDIMGQPGIDTVARILPNLKTDKKIDIVVAQAENVSSGKGINQKDYAYLKSLGVDFFTGGNHSAYSEDIISSLENESEPILRPANYPDGTPGKQYKYLKSKFGDILFVSLLGKVVGKDADLPMDNPLKVIDEILDKEKDHKKIATIVNFHGDYSSEKVVIGHYLDGRVTAVIGDHWHVPTADARILPKGTAHITDVGMVGILNSSLGIKLDIIFSRWKDGIKSRNELETEGPVQFNALLIEVSSETGLASDVEHIFLQIA